MPLVTDPDSLSQGASVAIADAVWGTPAARVVTITSAGTNIPALSDDEFIEFRDHSAGNNNGLYQVNGASHSTGSITVTKISGADPTAEVSEAVTQLGNSSAAPGSLKSVHIATEDRDVYILEQGNVDSTGVVTQALYSFLKEEWKDDNDLFRFPFPMVAVTPEQFEFSVNWNPADDNQSPLRFRTRRLMRTGGWSELNTTSDLLKQFIGAITLGAFVEATDRAYYQQGADPTDLTAAVDFVFAGPVNESLETYTDVGNPDTFTYVDGGGGNDSVTRASGSFITDGFRVGGQITTRNSNTAANDGTYTILSVAALTIEVATASFTTAEADAVAQVAVDNRNLLTLFLREGFSVALDPDSGKTFAQANLSDIGVTTLVNQVYRFPLANSADLKISTADATVSTRSPTVDISYFATAQVITGFNLNASSTLSPQTTAGFGIIIDAKGLSLEEVYEYTNYSLRQAANINANILSPGGSAVTGRTADELLQFVGDNLITLAATNPNGGGSGVAVINFSAADTNRLSQVDNDLLTRTFPFVAAGVISFNDNLQNDAGPARFTMYFQYTDRTVATTTMGSPTGPDVTITSAAAFPVVVAGEYIALSGFVEEANNGVYLVTGSPTTSSIDLTRYDSTLTLVAEGPLSINIDENPIDSPDSIVIDSASAFSPIPIDGVVAGPTRAYDFDYDNNAQGGRTPATDAAVVVRAIGTTTAQSVQTTGTIARTTTNNFSLVAPLERNFSNP